MIERGWLGEKRGQGFYKRVGKGADKEIRALDRKTLEYHPAQKVRFPAADAVRGVEDLGQRLRALVAGDEPRRPVPVAPVPRFRRFIRRSMVPEISDRIVEIDRAMRWGFGFALGPFETVGCARRARKPWSACAATIARVPGKRGAHAGIGRALLLRRPPTAKASPGRATSICTPAGTWTSSSARACSC